MIKKSMFWCYAFVNACLLLVTFSAFKQGEWWNVVSLIVVGIYITYLAERDGLYNH